MKKLFDHASSYVGGAALLSALLFAGCQTPTQQASTTTTGTTTMSSQPTTQSTTATGGASLRSDGEVVVFEDNLLTVTKRYLSGTTAGTEYRYRVTVDAKVPVGNAVLTEQLPESFGFVSATQAPSSNRGNDFVWNIGNIDPGAPFSVDLTVIPSAVGTYAACTLISADPRICLPLPVGMPALNIAKTGPARAEVGEVVEWEVIVRNTGTVTAENVTLVDTLPAGFSANSATSFNLGSIEPGASKTTMVSARGTQEGNFTNVAVANFRGGREVSASAPILIQRSGITITKTGRPEAFIFNREAYDIVVTNTGSTTLRNVVVTDRPDQETLRVISTDGAEIVDRNGDTVPEELIWRIAEFEPQGTRNYRVILTSTRPGQRDYPVGVVTESGLRDNAAAATRWKAVPGVLTWIVDNVDPIMIGDETIYTAHIQNQSEFEPFTVTASSITMGEEMQILEVSEGGTVNGQVVSFAPFNLAPREKVTQSVRVRGVKAGLTTAVMQTMTNFTEVPVQNSETTTVY